MSSITDTILLCWVVPSSMFFLLFSIINRGLIENGKKEKTIGIWDMIYLSIFYPIPWVILTGMLLKDFFDFIKSKVNKML
jgi:hypothetical protein